MKWQQAIEQIHTSDVRLVLAVTGGGSLAISDLLCIPGASKTVLQASATYAPAATRAWLGFEPDSYCSRATSLSMATVAWWKGRKLLDDESQSDQVVGIACTASLASVRPKRGEHRFHLAVQTSHATRAVSVTLAKGTRSRSEEEAVVRDLILSELARVAGVEATCPELSLTEADQTDEDSESSVSLVLDVISGRRDCIWSLPDGSLTATIEEAPRCVLSGSFNPLHDGHRELLRAAEQKLGGPVAFELPIINADKPPLDFLTIRDRRTQFTKTPLAITASPLFVEKARVFSGSTFVVGADTAMRIVDPRFYDDSEEAMAKCLKTIQSRGCRFLVAGRLVNGSWMSEDGLNVPDAFRDLFEVIPESEFRNDVSSTALRREASL